jgi:hypothetical protein
MPGATPHIRKVDFVPVGFSRHGDCLISPNYCGRGRRSIRVSPVCFSQKLGAVIQGVTISRVHLYRKLLS